MPKRISKRTTDANEIAFNVLQAVTAPEQPPTEDRDTISRIMAEMGRKGGKIGGKRSMDTMTATERKKRAKKAARSRWKKKPE